jgi:hypothetical protein
MMTSKFIEIDYYDFFIYNELSWLEIIGVRECGTSNWNIRDGKSPIRADEEFGEYFFSISKIVLNLLSEISPRLKKLCTSYLNYKQARFNKTEPASSSRKHFLICSS